jgi:NAD(P)-dependent dehydrogenase (short-subunit alcohol dehydrogenase family)
MANRLDGKVAVVTGSTRGFGFAIAQELLRAGSLVVVSGRSQAASDEAAQALNPLGRTLGYACDVTVPDQVYALAREALRWNGRIDIWINNAGHTPTAGTVIDFPPEEALLTLKTNCLGVYNGTQAALSVMLPSKRGVLVNIYGRGSNLKAATPSGLYAASKAWVTSYTRTLAAEYKGTGLQIIGFSPGMMLTDMLVIEEVIGERVMETMKNMPMVLKALANPPEIPAAELVELLETNRKEFMEYRFMRGWRGFSMIGRLIWMQIDPKARPAPQDYPLAEPYHPPIESKNDKD